MTFPRPCLPLLLALALNAQAAKPELGPQSVILLSLDPSSDSLALMLGKGLTGARLVAPQGLMPLLLATMDQRRLGQARKEALALVERGLEAYKHLSYGEAQRHLIEALSRLQPLAGVRGDMVRAWVGLAEARLASGDEGGASEALCRAVLLEPTLSLDPGLYPPPVIALRRGCPRDKEAAGGTIILRAGEGVVAKVNLRPGQPHPRGLAFPVPPGAHLVQVSAPGRVGVARWVEVAHGQTVELPANLPLSPEAQGLQAAWEKVLADPVLMGRTASEASCTISRTAGIRAMVVVGSYRAGKRRLAVCSRALTGPVRMAVLGLGSEELLRARETVASWLEGRALPPLGEMALITAGPLAPPAPPPLPLAPREMWYERWWIWTALAVGVAAVGATAWAAVEASDRTMTLRLGGAP